MQKSSSNTALLPSEVPLVREVSAQELPSLSPNLRKLPSAFDANGRRMPYSKLEPQHLSWYTQHDLKKRYPIDSLFVFAQASGLLAASIALILTFIGWHGISQVLAPESFLIHLHLLVVRVLFACALFSLLYWEFYRQTLEVRVVGFRIVYTMGVLWKLRRSLAIDPIMQVKVKQTQLDLLFNLYRIDIWIPGDSIGEKIVIPGLRRESAYSLHQFLTLELSRRIFLSQGALDRESEMRVAESVYTSKLN